MGRKGESKRKERQTKSRPLVSAIASGSMPSRLKVTDSQPEKSIDPGKSVPNKDGEKSSSDRKKKSRKESSLP